MAIKRTSSTLTLSASVLQTGANTTTIEKIPLQLNPLDNEVFIITGLNLDPDAPDSVANTSTTVECSLSTQLRTSVGTIADSNVVGAARTQIICNAGMTPDGGHVFVREDPLVAPAHEEYLAVVSSSDLFLNIVSTNNNNAKVCRARVYGYRAKADVATFNALLASELLSQ